jgi:hypothetical protein
MFRPILVMTFGVALAIPGFAVQPQSSNGNDDKHLDIQSSAGDLHMGSDADAKKIGLLPYPGAHASRDDKDSNAVNLGLLTEAFGIKLLVASYDSSDAPGKVIAFYKEQLKKYGTVLECRTHEHGGDVHVNDDKDDSKESAPVKCEGDNTWNIVEIKVGRQNNQHAVSVEPAESGNGSKFALVYFHARGKQGDI